MKVRRMIGLLVAVGLLASVLAVPAAAHTKSDAGVFTGVANVGKVGSCQQNGNAPVPTGGGIGFPFLTDLKKAWWRLETDLATVQHPTGLTLHACGRLAPVNLTPKRVNGSPKAAVGAACLISHGHDGWGEARLGGVPHYRLRNLGWPASAAMFLPVNGDLWVPHADGKFGKKTVGPVLAIVIARGVGCETKTFGPKGTGQGAENFNVVGVFAGYKLKGSAPDPNQKKGQENDPN